MTQPGNVLEKKYSEFSRKINLSKTPEELTKNISKLVQELEDLLKNRTNEEEVYKYVCALRYSNKKDRGIIKFIFSRLENLRADFGFVINPANVSLEHIHSQTPKTPKAGVDQDVSHSIGNLTLMEFSGRDGNGGLNNDSFEEKIETYKKSPYTMTRNLSNRLEWRLKEIDDRTGEFAELVWKIWGPSQEIKDFELP